MCGHKLVTHTHTPFRGVSGHERCGVNIEVDMLNIQDARHSISDHSSRNTNRVRGGCRASKTGAIHFNSIQLGGHYIILYYIGDQYHYLHSECS